MFKPTAIETGSAGTDFVSANFQRGQRWGATCCYLPRHRPSSRFATAVATKLFQHLACLWVDISALLELSKTSRCSETFRALDRSQMWRRAARRPVWGWNQLTGDDGCRTFQPQLLLHEHLACCLRTVSRHFHVPTWTFHYRLT